MRWQWVFEWFNSNLMCFRYHNWLAHWLSPSFDRLKLCVHLFWAMFQGFVSRDVKCCCMFFFWTNKENNRKILKTKNIVKKKNRFCNWLERIMNVISLKYWIKYNYYYSWNKLYENRIARLKLSKLLRIISANFIENKEHYWKT